MGTIEDLERDWEEAEEEDRKKVENNLRAGDILGQQIADELGTDITPLEEMASDPAIQGLLSKLLASDDTMINAMINNPSSVSHFCELVLFIGARWQREKDKVAAEATQRRLLDSLDD